jgi:hypothetical protein
MGVQSNNSSWVAIANSLGSAPAVGNPNWQLLALGVTGGGAINSVTSGAGLLLAGGVLSYSPTNVDYSLGLVTVPTFPSRTLAAHLATLPDARITATGAATPRSLADHLATVPDAKVIATGAATPRYLADHLATLPDSKVIATGSTTPISIQDWQAQFVNVKAFGAKGDGVTDDTTAIQAAIFAVSQSSIPPASLASAYRYGGTVFFPKGKYKTTATLYVPAYVNLQGSGRVFFDNGNIATVPAAQCPGTVIFFVPAVAASYALQSGNFVVASGALKTTTTDILGADIDAGTYSEVRDVTVRDLTVATATAGVLGGILMTGAATSSLANVGAVGTFTNGVRVSGSWSFHARQVGINVTNAGGVGFQFFNAANGCSVENSYVSTNDVDGTAYIVAAATSVSARNLIAEVSLVGFVDDGSDNTEWFGLYAERVLGKILSVTANGSLCPHFTNIRVINSPAAVLFDDQLGAVSAEVRGYSAFNGVVTILGNTTADTQVTFWGISPTASDVLTVNNATAIKFIPDSKHETLAGTQYIEHRDMPAAGAAYHQIEHKFTGVTNYNEFWTPTEYQLQDNAGNTRFRFAFDTLRFETVGGISPGDTGNGAQSGAIYQGAGAPSNADGNDGDMFFRTDTPGTLNQRIYIKNAGTWTGFA